MSFFAKIGEKLVGGGIISAATGIADAVDRFVETPDEKRAAETIKAKILLEPDKWQAEINKVGAAHRSLFVAGWRPFIGWVCGVSLACFFIPQYSIGAYLWVKMSLVAGELVAYPVSADAVLELVLALLGMSTLRMFEKGSGVSK